MPPKRKATGEPAVTPAAKKPSSKPTSSKRKSFSDRLTEMDEDEIATMMAEVEQIEAECIGFRYATSSTQHKQDAHLRAYRAFIRFAHHLEPNIPDAETDAIGWPVDHEELRGLLKSFLAWTFVHVKGLGPTGHMAYSSLSQYRDSMLFWVPRVYDDLKRNIPLHTKLHYEMTQTMCFLQDKYSVRDRKKKKAGMLGLIELRQLLDFTTANAKVIEVTEQFLVLLCLARQTALRPGSIGPGKHREKEYMRWSDWEFTNKGNGKFSALVEIKNLKTNKADPNSGQWVTLQVFLDSPNEENLPLSVPHRMLEMALRRGIIEGITTIDELMNTDLSRIRIKAEHLDDPCFYGGIPGGRGLSDTPLSANAISAWVSDRGRALGYTETVTLYSFRHRTATDLVARIGFAATREIMGHDPRSSTIFAVHIPIIH